MKGPKMGRLKAWQQQLNPLFSSKYKKLLEDYGSKDYSKLLLQESLQDYISYNCGHCGHMQKLQAEELNSIVGHAFRLAYAAHLQKSGAVPPPSYSPSSSSPSSTPRSTFTYTQHESPRTSSTVPHNRRIQQFRKSPSPHHTSSCSRSVPLATPPLGAELTNNSLSSSCSSSHLANTHTHNDQRPCGSPTSNSERVPASHSDGNFCNSSRPSSRCGSRSPETFDPTSVGGLCPNQCSEGGVEMRTPAAASSAVAKPPTSLPGLLHSDQQNNNLQTPDSDTSNSPTELNTSKRLGEKPSLLKNLNICMDTCRYQAELNVRLSGNCGVSSQGTIGSMDGYVNEKHTTSSCSSSDVFSNSDNNASIDEKCRFLDDFHVKRLSNSSSVHSGNVLAHNGNLPDESSTPSVCNASTNTPPPPPPLPERSDSLTPPEEPHLKTAAWFQAGIPREIALEVLGREPTGAFMVRESTSKPGCFALSLRVPPDFTVSGIAHYLIVKSNKGYKIKGFTKDFVTLTALITHHSVMPELLPCPLLLSRYNPSFTAEDDRDDGDDGGDEDPDYNTLSDFRKMMADLNI